MAISSRNPFDLYYHCSTPDQSPFDDVSAEILLTVRAIPSCKVDSDVARSFLGDFISKLLRDFPRYFTLENYLPSPSSKFQPPESLFFRVR